MIKECFYYDICQMHKKFRKGCMCEYFWDGSDVSEKEYLEDMLCVRCAEEEEEE